MLNRAIIVGRLVRNPELKYTPSGVAVCSFVIASNRPFKNKQGEQEADFINCVVWRQAAENVSNYLQKGSLAGVDGRIQTRSYEGQDGKRVYVTEVVADTVQFLEPKKQGGQSKGQRYTADPGDPFQDNGQPVDIQDDQLPF